MNMQDLHRKAIDLAKSANIELENGNLTEYKKLTLEAYFLEKKAAEFLSDKLDAEPTRSVLYRSAATLAFKCEKYGESIDLITQALLGNPFDEIKIELLDLLKRAIGLRTVSPKSKKSNDYLESVRGHSISVKIEEKTGKYAGAFVVSHVVEVLKSIEQSFQNYGESKFIKEIDKDSLPDFDYSLNKFKGQCTLLGADLGFSSFGISIGVDNSVMDQFNVYAKGFKEMKENLFEEFKEDVLYARYDDPAFQERIANKFTEEERRKIYSPIVNTLAKTKGYKISVTDEEYEYKIKEFTPLNNSAKQTLIPLVSKNSIIEEDPSLTRKIEQLKGNKKTVIWTEQVKYLEQEITTSSIEYEKNTVYFNEAHTVLLIFENNYYRIEDGLYKVTVTDKDFNDILILYNKVFIANYIHLMTNKESLSLEEIELLEFIEQSTVRDW